ncbi:hypothetical protein [Isoptericola sp. b408]|uniref:hypothetical protein n=1 Tax=Isoptericola sp. b408 TaxID=3064653 RepID=UPI002713CDE4|nr:hypothetical protein [Isoptericola sp. b408]MDO8152307.1 hypothetical protein [Isoptericola sp. b408]
MAAPSKIQNVGEAIQWIESGWTYQEIVDEYRRKYNIETTLSMWSNFRHRRGLARRINRDDELIPWAVDPRHRNSYHLAMLRVESRRRNGWELREVDASRLASWKRDVVALDAVVHYDPRTPDGFHLIPRESQDHDLIRQPTAGRTKRHRAE